MDNEQLTEAIINLLKKINNRIGSEIRQSLKHYFFYTPL